LKAAAVARAATISASVKFIGALCEAEDKCNGTSAEVSFQLGGVVQPCSAACNGSLHCKAVYSACISITALCKVQANSAAAQPVCSNPTDKPYRLCSTSCSVCATVAATTASKSYAELSWHAEVALLQQQARAATTELEDTARIDAATKTC
jgi:hypothetical protein